MLWRVSAVQNWPSCACLQALPSRQAAWTMQREENRQTFERSWRTFQLSESCRLHQVSLDPYFSGRFEFAHALAGSPSCQPGPTFSGDWFRATEDRARIAKAADSKSSSRVRTISRKATLAGTGQQTSARLACLQGSRRRRVALCRLLQENGAMSFKCREYPRRVDAPARSGGVGMRLSTHRQRLLQVC